jgi:GNAT superfamily N-acetyltransferase
MNVYNSKESPNRVDTFYTFLKLSFPDLSHNQYQKINNGRNFEGWIWLEDNRDIVACTAIFRKSNGYKMGLFCTHPQKRRTGIGSAFYKNIVKLYHPLEWTAITAESIKFYISMGAKNLGDGLGVDGRRYTTFICT